MGIFPPTGVHQMTTNPLKFRNESKCHTEIKPWNPQPILLILNPTALVADVCSWITQIWKWGTT
ncbi:hypothetical protein TorRG33x02_030680 [Trema orientale]|uniref:Uncharacterized protein n=1 Tax=Trema orientale TaxID=63057 RepID=A0A2P5FU51_TREOI|nr:hypothetical protein TorRG33x02_030680 [Trema orientale]